MRFKEIFKELRKEKGISAEKLAKKLCFTKNIVYAWEKGRAEPNYETLVKLADFFDVSIDFLVGRLDDFDNVTIKTLEIVPGLSVQQKELLEYFDKLGPFEQEAILIQVKALAEKSAVKTK